jgi:signal peptidase
VDLFFVTVFPVFALNAVLTYLAFNSSMLTLVIIRSVFSLTVIFLPVLPNCPAPVWPVVSCGMMFVTLMLYHFFTRDRNRLNYIKNKRYAKYRGKTALTFIAPSVSFLLLFAFSLRIFPYFPVIVITDSMTGALDRGSVVIIEKLRAQDVYSTVNEGDVIHFRVRNIEVAHRVVEIRYNEADERVYITKGDANPTPDAEPVQAEQIIGISRASVSYIGYPFVFVMTVFGE